jgi:hypothetical protein
VYKTAPYQDFGYKPLRRQLNLSYLVLRGDFLMADEMISTLTAYVHVMTPVQGMPLNFLQDIIVFGLRGISSSRFLLLLASFGLLLSLAALGPGHHHWTFPLSHDVR